MIKKIFAIILLLSVPVFSFAITLEEAVNYAIENSEAIKITKESAKSLRSAGDQAVAFVKPQLTLNAGYTEMGDNKPETPYAFLSTPGSDITTGLNVSQLLFAGGRIGRSADLRKNYYQQAGLNEISGKRDIKTQVRLAFDTFLYQKAAIDILKDRLRQRQTEIEDARDLRDVGMVTSLDVRQAKLSYNFSQDEFKAGEASYKEALINFNLAIGRSGDEELLIPKGNLENIPDMRAILDELRESLSSDELIDIKSLQTQTETARINYEIAHGEYFPEIAMVASGKTAGEKYDDMDESWHIGVQIQWNIFDGWLVKSKKASARADMQKARETLVKTKKDLAGTVEKIGVHITSLEQRVTLQKEAVELSRENYEDARGQYRAGTVTLTRLGEFNLSYAEARFNLLRLHFLQRELLSSAEALLEK